MSMQDPISDMLTIIRNGQFARKKLVNVMYSKIKLSIIDIIKKEGFILDYRIFEDKIKLIEISLKYFNNIPVIENIKRISKPSLRVYSKKNLNKFRSNFGIVIISSSKGVITDRLANKLNIGGEVICTIS